VTVGCLFFQVGHVGAVKDLHWRPNGQMLASCSEDGKIMLWNGSTGAHIHTLEGHSDWVLSVRWRPDGARLLSCSWDGSMRMWSPTDGKCLAVYQGNLSPATMVRWRPDGRMFANCGVDRFVHVYDAVEEDTNDAKVLLRGHTDSVSSIAWRPDGQYLMSISLDGTARTWNPKTRETVAVMQCGGQCYLTVAWQQTGTMIAAGGKDNTLSVWKPEGAAERSKKQARILTLATTIIGALLPITLIRLSRTMSKTVQIVLPLLADVEPIVPSTTGGATTENQDPTSGSRAEPAAEHTPAELLPSEPFSMPKVHLDALEGQGGAVPPPTLIQPKNTVTRAKQQIGRGT
jgi:WD40 repeat protein